MITFGILFDMNFVLILSGKITCGHDETCFMFSWKWL